MLHGYTLLYFFISQVKSINLRKEREEENRVKKEIFAE